MIDFHCHLDLYPDPAAIVRECAARRMYVLSVTTTPSAWSGTNALALNQQRIRTAVGLHPRLANQRKIELGQFRELLSQTRYVGEVGLDGSPECLPFWQEQVEVFDNVLRSCAELGGRIVSVHSRRAEDEVLSRLEHFHGAGSTVLHWFSGSRKALERAIELDCWFSVGPSMFLTKNGRSLVERMPPHRILTESDGPFASSGDRPAVPWDVEDAVRGLSVMWKRPAAEVEEQLFDNLRALLEHESLERTRAKRFHD